MIVQGPIRKQQEANASNRHAEQAAKTRHIVQSNGQVTVTGARIETTNRMSYKGGWVGD